jgi:hypothetical protein
MIKLSTFITVYERQVLKSGAYLEDKATWVMATIVFVTLVPIFAPSTIGMTLRKENKSLLSHL